MFRCCHWYAFRSELFISSSIFDIPNRPLNSSDNMAYESQKMEIQAVPQHTVVREASEHADWLQDTQSVRVKSRPDREFRAYRLFGRRRRYGMRSEQLEILLCAIKVVYSFPDHHWAIESQITRSVFPVRRIALHQFLIDDLAPTNAVVARRELRQTRRFWLMEHKKGFQRCDSDQDQYTEIWRDFLNWWFIPK
jgi:hypothetical protein